jgi:hypothetical protein
LFLLPFNLPLPLLLPPPPQSSHPSPENTAQTQASILQYLYNSYKDFDWLLYQLAEIAPADPAIVKPVLDVEKSEKGKRISEYSDFFLVSEFF